MYCPNCGSREYFQRKIGNMQAGTARRNKTKFPKHFVTDYVLLQGMRLIKDKLIDTHLVTIRFLKGEKNRQAQ
jgi:hypothetical protein